MISVGIVGASGYTGEELATILLGHPHAKITVLTSRTHAGEKVNDVFSLPSDINTTFLEPTTENLKDYVPKNCGKIIVDNVLLATAKITKVFYPESINDNFDFDFRLLSITETDIQLLKKYQKLSLE